MEDPTRPTAAPTPARTRRTEAISPEEKLNTEARNGSARPMREKSRALAISTI